MYFHNSLIPRGAYVILPLESKQEATSGWNSTKCISEVKVNQLKVKNMHVKMDISTFNPNSITHHQTLQKLSPKHAARGVAQSPYPIYRHGKACLSKQPPWGAAGDPRLARGRSRVSHLPHQTHQSVRVITHYWLGVLLTLTLLHITKHHKNYLQNTQHVVLRNHPTLSIGTERLACLNNPRGVQLGTLA